MKIVFSKLSGAGNDFIVIDNRARTVQLSPAKIRELCTRGTGIGADGLILIEPSTGFDFTMKYHNADGFPGSMCGNGGRCAVYFAFTIGMIPAMHDSYTFEANRNRYEAWVTSKDTVKIRMLPPIEFRYDLDIEGFLCHSVNTGSPHVVTYVSDLNSVKVNEIGRSIRHRTDLFHDGTNVNFIAITSPESLSIRTFERGVEDETLACGTGAVAAALMSQRLGKISNTCVRVQVKSGDILTVQFNEEMNQIFLTGPAKIIFEGSFTLD